MKQSQPVNTFTNTYTDTHTRERTLFGRKQIKFTKNAMAKQWKMKKKCRKRRLNKVTYNAICTEKSHTLKHAPDRPSSASVYDRIFIWFHREFNFDNFFATNSMQIDWSHQFQTTKSRNQNKTPEFNFNIHRWRRRRRKNYKKQKKTETKFTPNLLHSVVRTHWVVDRGFVVQFTQNTFLLDEWLAMTGNAHDAEIPFNSPSSLRTNAILRNGRRSKREEKNTYERSSERNIFAQFEYARIREWVCVCMANSKQWTLDCSSTFRDVCVEFIFQFEW